MVDYDSGISHAKADCIMRKNMSRDNITIMTMNLRFGLAKDGENSWENRRSLVAEILNRYPADFIGFQEVNHNQARFLERHLPGHNHIGWYNKNTPWWQSNMIFHHNSWCCMGSRHHFISKTPDLPSKLEGSKWPRQCVVGWFQNKDREILAVNTHFDFDEQVQEKSADLVVDFLNRFPAGLPVVITGDFNSNPGSPAYERFLANGFKEVFYGREMNTFHEFEGRETGLHIDWILYRGDLRVNTRQVILDDFSGKFPSDHYPVRSVLGWGNRSAGDDGGSEGS